MNFQQASDRLDKPRKQDSKNIGHKLKLYKSWPTSSSDNGDTSRINLQYFNTDILTWYPDGGVIIRGGGYWDSPCTRDKINEYSPRGWRMEMQHLRFNPKMRAAYVSIRTEKWDFVRAMPYEDGVRFYEDGRADHKGSPLHDVDASSIGAHITETVEHTVKAFLRGDLAPPTIEEDLTALDVQTMAGIVDREQQRLQKIVRVARSREASSTLIYAVIDREYKNSFRLNQLELYRPGIYELTEGSVRTAKARIAQMEHFLRVGNNRARYAKNSSEYHSMRKDLLAECERFLFQELGFELKEYERHPRSHW